MSDDEYADDGFEASGGASSPGNAADVLKNAASSLKEPITSTAPNSYRSPRVDPPSNKSSARGKSSTMKAALGENDLNSSNAGTPNPLSSTAPSIPSASVPPKKKSKEKKKEERRKEKKLRKKEKKEKRAKRKGGEKERPPSPKFASRLWASNTRSLFARSVELTSGTRHGSALMHGESEPAGGSAIERDTLLLTHTRSRLRRRRQRGRPAAHPRWAEEEEEEEE